MMAERLADAMEELQALRRGDNTSSEARGGDPSIAHEDATSAIKEALEAVRLAP
jgi:hypothetical protein